MAKHRTFSGDGSPYLHWHRGWGDALYSTDLDLLEYTYSSSSGQPVAVGAFEYKHLNAPVASPTDAQLHLIADVATRASLPAFFVRYTGATDGYAPSFFVYPMNLAAEETGIAYEGVHLSERAYANFLHRLRGDTTPPGTAVQLSTARPDVEWVEDNPPFLS